MDEDKQREEINFDAEVASHALNLRGRKLTASIAFVAGTGFTLFGFVQSIVYVMDEIPTEICIMQLRPRGYVCFTYCWAGVLTVTPCLKSAIINIDAPSLRRSSLKSWWIAVIQITPPCKALSSLYT